MAQGLSVSFSLSVCLSISHLSIHPSTGPSIHLSIYRFYLLPTPPRSFFYNKTNLNATRLKPVLFNYCITDILGQIIPCHLDVLQCSVHCRMLASTLLASTHLAGAVNTSSPSCGDQKVLPYISKCLLRGTTVPG